MMPNCILGTIHSINGLELNWQHVIFFNWTIMDKLQQNCSPNTNIFVKENAFENVCYFIEASVCWNKCKAVPSSRKMKHWAVHPACMFNTMGTDILAMQGARVSMNSHAIYLVLFSHVSVWTTVAYFTKEVNPNLAKLSFKFNGSLAKLVLTS